MADTYSRHWDGHGSVHSYCPPSLTKAASRMPRLMAEVLAFAPDIICLQECDKSWFETMWSPTLDGEGFDGVFACKRSAGSSEGVATFVRRSKFEVLRSGDGLTRLGRRRREWYQPWYQPAMVPAMVPAMTAMVPARADASSSACRCLPPRSGLTRACEGCRPSDSCSCSERRSGDAAQGQSGYTSRGRRVLLANTHLYFANPAVHVRLMQIAALLHHAERARDWAGANAEGGASEQGASE